MMFVFRALADSSCGYCLYIPGRGVGVGEDMFRGAIAYMFGFVALAGALFVVFGGPLGVR